MTEEQEKDYQVKDKRRFNPDGTPKEDVPEETPVPEEATQTETPAETEPEEEPEEDLGDVPPPNVYAFLGFASSMLVELAWELMGIRVAPGSKEPVKDMAQAKVAIDTLAFVFDQIHSQLNEEERKMYRALISDLRLNFVRHT